MSIRKAIGAASALTLFAIALLVWATTHKDSGIKVTVLFAGYTNTANRVRLAVMRVNNGSATMVRRWAVYDVKVKSERMPRRPRCFGQDASLAPGQSELYLFPAYTNEGDWRVMLYFSKADLHLSLVDAREKLPSCLRRLVPTSFQSVPSEPVWSDWITN